MIEISQKQQNILQIVLRGGTMSSSDIHTMLGKGGGVSLVTVKRTLSEMVKIGALTVEGSGPATVYTASVAGRLFSDIDPKEYCTEEPDKRYGSSRFNFDLFQGVPLEIFSDQELDILDSATKEYKKRTSGISGTLQKRELERLVIELSWKSSKIEGNTYTLLDTEKLILENKEAKGHDRREAQMIINHKNAFALVHEERSLFRGLSRANMERLHAVLTEGLGVETGLRQKPVGVLGSKFRPLDNIHQIREAVNDLVVAVSKVKTPYAKALLALVGISYIQPFEDGNKRTSRLMANAILLAHGCAPLSYRSVDENEYREAMLVFYEINSIVPVKKIFVEQYDFGARNYAAK